MEFFIWLESSQVPRKGPELLEGQVHSAADYPPGVLAEWVATGAAAEADPTDLPKKAGDKPKKEKG